MLDLLNEILATMKRNKMRTFLTGFAVAWGIFMLIVLLAAGNGLRNGMMSNFQGRAINTISVNPGWTSMPYKGYRANRRILFDERTIDYLSREIPEIEHISGGFGQNTNSFSYGEEYGAWRLEACMPDISYINYIIITKGRFINEADMRQRRKVVVIGEAQETILFKGEDPVGKYINADGIAYQVVGVYKRPLAQSFDPPCYIPLTTGKMLYDRGWGIRRIEFTVTGIKTIEEADALSERIRQKLGPYAGFDPADRSAVWLWNSAKQAVETQNIFLFINMFLWVIGFASLMAGIVGVGNIMLITVKERTREIGIRKAIGATPWSIIKMIIVEAIFITTCAGYVGIVLGIGLVELVARNLPQGGGENNMTVFLDPSVSIGVVLAATALLIACGIVAGLIPSLRATRIRPIEAMRAD